MKDFQHFHKNITTFTNSITYHILIFFILIGLAIFDILSANLSLIWSIELSKTVILSKLSVNLWKKSVKLKNTWISLTDFGSSQVFIVRISFSSILIPWTEITKPKNCMKLACLYKTYLSSYSKTQFIVFICGCLEFFVYIITSSKYIITKVSSFSIKISFM